MKKLLLAVVLAITSLAHGTDSQFKPNMTVLLSAATTTGAGQAFEPSNRIRTFSASGTTTAGAGAAVIKIQATNLDTPADTDWIDLGSITLTLATTNSAAGFVSDAPWRFVRANVSSISGTGASVNSRMGY